MTKKKRPSRSHSHSQGVKKKLSQEEARNILREYPDADLSAFEVDGDADKIAMEEAVRSIGALTKKSTKGFISPPVSDEQKKILEALTSGEYTNFAALSGRFQKQNVAYIVAVNTDQGERGLEFTMKPVAIIIDSAFLEKFGDRMLDATGFKPTEDP